MTKQYDVTALGELLIDLTQNGVSHQGNPILEANPGGAPCNVLACLSRLGRSTAFLGKVGRDGFGIQLYNTIREAGIDAQGLRWEETVPTTLAVVHTAPDGDRDFSFYRSPGADVLLSWEEVSQDQIRESRIFHFGSLSMTAEPCRSATCKAIALAEEAGCLRSFDPNLRPPLWESLDQARTQIEYGLNHCDILKIADNEILWLSGQPDYDSAVCWLRQRYDIPLVLLTLGKQGSRAYCAEAMAEVPGFRVDTIDTTGAGDTFLGAMLHQILEMGWRSYTEAELKAMLGFANAAAALVTTKKGALRSMPEAGEIHSLLSCQA